MSTALLLDNKVKGLFGQGKVLHVIGQLGGKATRQQIKEYLQKHDPQTSVIKTLGRELNAMNHYQIEKRFDGKMEVWELRQK